MNKPLDRNLKEDAAAVPVAWQSELFGAYSGKCFRTAMPLGLSIAEIVARVPDLRPDFLERGVVCINGHEIAREHWHSVRPKAAAPDRPVAVTLHYPAGRGGGGGIGAGLGGGQGGGGLGTTGKNVLLIIAAIALIALTAWIGGGGLAFLGPAFASGAFGAHLLAAGIGVVGSLLLSALSPPPAALNQDGGASDAIQRASVSGNVLGRGSPLPRVVGTRRVFPPMICEPWVQVVNNEEYALAIFALAGPHKLEEVQINGVTLDPYYNNGDTDVGPFLKDQSFWYQTREGWDDDAQLENMSTFRPLQYHTDAERIELSAHLWDDNDGGNMPTGTWAIEETPQLTSVPVWHRFTTRRNPDSCIFHLDFPQGLTIDGAGAFGTAGAILPVRMRVRPKGTSTWHNLPETWFYGDTTKPQRIPVYILFTDGTGVNNHAYLRQDSGDIIPIYFWAQTPACSSPAVDAWVADAAWNNNNGDPDYYGPTVYITGATLPFPTDVRGVTVTSRNEIAFQCQPDEWGVADPADLPDDDDSGGVIWEVEIMRGAVFQASQSDLNHQVGVANWDFFSYQYGTAAGSPQIPVQTRPQNNLIDNIAVARFISAWTKHAVGGVRYGLFGPGAADSPGHALLWVMAKNRAINSVSVKASGYVRDYESGSPSGWINWTTTSNPAPHFRHVLTDTLNRKRLNDWQIDDASLVAWRSNCATRGYECNAVLSGGSIADALNIIAGCGYARPFKSDLWGVAYDRERSAEDPVQIFTPRNMGSFNWSRAFPDLPDHLIVSYYDEDDDYRQTEIVVYADGYDIDSATLGERIEYAGITDSSKATARAKYDLRVMRYRATFYSGDVFVENIVCRRGDLIGVQHDILKKHVGAARIKTKTDDGASPSLIASVELDGAVPLNLDDDGNADASIDMGAAIRLRDGTIITKRLAYVGDWSTTLSFATPFEDPGDILGPDCLVAVGIAGAELRRLIVMEIAPAADLRAGVIAVDEGVNIWIRKGGGSTSFSFAGVATGGLVNRRVTTAGNNRVTTAGNQRVTT